MTNYIDVSGLDLLVDFALSEGVFVHYLATAEDGTGWNFVSKNIVNLTGYSSDQFVKDPEFMRTIVHPDDLYLFDRRKRETNQTTVTKTEYRITARTGEDVSILDEYRTCRRNGRIHITGRLKKLDSHIDGPILNQSLMDAIEVLPSGFAIYDSDARLVFANNAITGAYEIDNEEVVGLSRLEFIKLLVPHIEKFDGILISGTESYAHEIDKRISNLEIGSVEIKLKDGRWRLLTSHPTHDGGLVVVATDITNVKRAEFDIEKSHNLVRNVLEACPLPILMATVEGKLLYESPISRRMLGAPDRTDELSVLDYYVDLKDRDEIVKLLRQSGSIKDYECQFKRTDGTQFPATVSSKMIEYLGQEVFVSTITDLTEQKLREDELKSAQETLSVAIEALDNGFALFDSEDRLLLCNSKYIEFNPTISDEVKPGAKGEDLQRTAVERGQYPDMVGRAEEWTSNRRKMFAEATKRSGYRQSDNRWYELSVHPTRDGSRLFYKKEITHHKQMEESLRESEAQVRLILENCPLPITMSYLYSGEIVYESPASKNLFYHEGHKNFESVLPRWADLSIRESYIEQIKKTGSIDDFEAEFRKPDGTTFWGEVSARLIEYMGHDVVVSCTLDMSDRKAIDQELHRQQEVLHQSEKLGALGELLAGISHELNNPLTVLVGQSLLLKETASDPALIKRAESIGAAADRCARIVKSFLALARQESLKRKTLEINTVVENALEVTAYSLRSCNIEIELDLDENLPSIFVDPNQLGQVIINLIVNAQHALDSMKGTRVLDLETGFDKKNNVIFVRVSDNGPGVPSDLQNRIFEPLFTTKKIGAGTGIGLSLCHRIISAHGGKIFLEKSNLPGASFIIQLPISQTNSDETVSPTEQTRSVPKLNVIVVDDEPDVASLIEQILENDGHSVKVAHTGNQALSLIAVEEFDLILSDIRMPEMDGPDLHRQLSLDWPEMASRMAFITGDTLGEASTKFLKNISCPFLEKPITPSDVRELIEKFQTDRIEK